MIYKSYIAILNNKVLDSQVRAYTAKFDGVSFKAPDKTTLLFTESLTTQEESDIDAIVETLKEKERIKSEYKMHQTNGFAYFEEVRADLRMLVDSGTLSFYDAKDIEEQLNQVKSEIITGDWYTGMLIMAEITPAPPLTQEMYDDIYNYIVNYVTENYGQ